MEKVVLQPRPQARLSAPDYVIEQIKQALVSESLKPGDRLPSESELEALYGVSRGSIRQAMKSLEMLGEGELDAFVTLDAYSDPEKCTPLWKIGDSDFFFVVSKDRPDLLAELNMALNQIQDEDKYYAEKLAAKYLRDAGSNRFLSAAEVDWLVDHGPIRVGYQDNYLAFCAKDPKTGELTGALKDYLEYAAGTLANAEPVFEAVAYPTASAAMEALKSGEIDCMFPANLTDYDGEMSGVVMTAPLMRTEMDAVICEEDKQYFLKKSKVRVAVNSGNPNYEMFLVDHFPSWTPVTYDTTATCLDQIAQKNADCIIISNYRYSDIARLCERLGISKENVMAFGDQTNDLYSVVPNKERPQDYGGKSVYGVWGAMGSSSGGESTTTM